MNPIKKIKTLYVSFDAELKPNQVSAFRGAIVEKVGKAHVMYHNHLSAEKVIYAYPLIQYKSINGKPSIFCIGEGVEHIHLLLQQKDLNIQVNDEKMTLNISKLEMNQFTLNVWKDVSGFSIWNWLPFNQENYKTYKSFKSDTDKISFFEKILIGNILSFAKGVDWRIEEQVVCKIKNIKAEKTVRYKGNPLMAIDIEFESNVFLPHFIGLGKGVSHGFGILRGIKKI
jgi:hypothetical protein